MAAPNIAATTNIIGKLDTAAVTTSMQVMVSNPASSGKVYKINTLFAVNVTGATATDMHISLFRGSSEVPIIRFTAVPADATLVVISKDNPLWLEEGDSIKAQAGANGRTVILCSYEIIS
jgi:hypothetical protein